MLKLRLVFLISFIFLNLIISTLKACTIFSCNRAGKVLVAANEDDNTPFTRIWYNPATKDRYGSICFGGPDMQVASAMNEHGLFFDFAAASYDLSKLNLNRPFNGFLMWEVLGKSKNVKEALEIIRKYDYNNASQILIADKEGNSVLVNPKGIIEKKGDFLVNANCNIINGKISCRRPEIVNESLSRSKKNTVDFLKEILNKTHQEGEKLTTLYSTICDLKNGIIYVYLYHNYESYYKIDLKAELKKGYRIENLADHFNTNFAYEEFSKNHALYLKESIFNEMLKQGTEVTTDKYIAESKVSESKNSKLDSALLEVALQLVKYSWNKQSNGGMWEYWFSMPNGYNLTIIKDERLNSAKKILQYLSEKDQSDIKLRNFTYEMLAYVNLIQGDLTTAKDIYTKAISNPNEAYNVTLTRGKEILSRLN
ncbi:carcinine hydrolase/isopenicillin-N N-acyltransferase family protein [Elizabethkingia ursingii]|uniref:carcinine hydrolase/isopenicillin-N N-acyltransferase family protein n=1 Tax=Elizabethkingia ursingii TaxID=1756150 RepID=UPI00201171AC|nr:carcinine hydrolase/isopenicillin-N N-acyltransferase family protein [Elizabethkingia ursingii]MCL1673736.1 carcinine hydrolase/isopenicillin-N N-acyltransferase family protein [Elizabethkingia ursingii]